MKWNSGRSLAYILHHTLSLNLHGREATSPTLTIHTPAGRRSGVVMCWAPKVEEGGTDENENDLYKVYHDDGDYGDMEIEELKEAIKLFDMRTSHSLSRLLLMAADLICVRSSVREQRASKSATKVNVPEKS